MTPRQREQNTACKIISNTEKNVFWKRYIYSSIPELVSFSQRPVHKLTLHQFLISGFSILAVYSLVQGNLKRQLCLLSSILGTTSQALIMLSFFDFHSTVLWLTFFTFSSLRAVCYKVKNSEPHGNCSSTHMQLFLSV